MIRRLSEVVKSHKNRVEVVTQDPVLANFLKTGGDWHFLAKAPEEDLRRTTGGNNTDWLIEGDVVTLSDQFGDAKCEIKLPVLIDAIKKLEDCRRYNASW